MADLTTDVAGTNTTGATAQNALGGNFVNNSNTGAAAVPGRTGPFANYLFPAMGDELRFGVGPVRDTTREVEAQLGVYDLMGRNVSATNPGGIRTNHYGPIGDSGVTFGAGGKDLEGYTQRLNLAALLGQAKIHEKMILQRPRFWINAIKSERFAPHAGWEKKIEVFRGGLMPQTGLSRWRKLLPVPEGGFNNPSNYPGFQTYETTTEEYVGTGYETGWGSETIDVDFLRNVPDAAQRVKEYLEFGVTEGLNIREIYNRETYIQLSNLAHKAFVMCTECNGVEDSGSRVYLYDPHIALDAIDGSDSSIAGLKDMDGNSPVSGSSYAMVDDRTVVNASKKLLCKLVDFRDCYGQWHAKASMVTDPKTKQPNPFILVDAGPANSALPVGRPNFDMLERITDLLEQICPEQAVGNEDGAPVFGITLKPDDINKLAKANPAEWRAYLEARPEALLSYYGLVKGKTYRRWSIVNDTNQMRFKPIRYIAEYNVNAAKDYGNLGFRPGDDTSIQNRAVYVCVAVDPLMNSTVRKGTNGVAVPVPNPDYFDAPLAIANVYLRDTFINQLEGAPEGVGNGTEFGPFPIFNGSWGFLNIRDRETNPFGTKGNFYGIFRTHVQPTKYTREAMSFVYARDTQAFEAFTQAQNKIINPTYTGKSQDVAVLQVSGSASSATAVSSGSAFDVTLSPTPHVALGVGNIAELKGADKSAEVVILDDSAWPVVTIAPTADLTLADVGLKATGADNKLAISDGATVTLAAV